MALVEGGSLTSIAGVEVGHWTDADARTGCTVVTLPEPNVIAGETRGAAPGSRETALLEPGCSVEMAQAIVLTGGSAFGLASADGVMASLESDGRGHPTPAGVVPIVPTAAIYDLLVGEAAVRPTAENGSAAYASRTSEPVGSGAFGAGTGATASKWRGLLTPSGIGSAAVTVGETTVAALVVCNALGDAFSLEGEALTGGSHVAGPLVLRDPPEVQNTTLVVVATDAPLGRAELSRLCVRAHGALAACIRPVHTAFDGDTVFAVSTGSGEPDPEAPGYRIGEMAFEAVGRAIEAIFI